MFFCKHINKKSAKPFSRRKKSDILCRHLIMKGQDGMEEITQERTDEDIKMMIVMRRDLGMRKGKIAAQAGHACVEAVLHAIRKVPEGKWKETEEGWTAANEDLETYPVLSWLHEGQKKVCVYTDGEEKLMMLAKELEERGVACSVIRDAGHTEFHGKPTITCFATEPAPASKLDPVTSALPLF